MFDKSYGIHVAGDARDADLTPASAQEEADQRLLENPPLLERREKTSH